MKRMKHNEAIIDLSNTYTYADTDTKLKLNHI
jgi:hypothetical protein